MNRGLRTFLGWTLMALAVSAHAKPGKVVTGGWYPPAPGRWVFDLYIDDGNGFRRVLPQPTTATSLVIEGLVAGQDYTLKVVEIGPVGQRAQPAPWKERAVDLAEAPAREEDGKNSWDFGTTFERGAPVGLFWRTPDTGGDIAPERIMVGLHKDIPVLRMRAKKGSRATTDGEADLSMPLLPQGRCEVLKADAKYIVADLAVQGSARVGLGYQEGRPGGAVGTVWLSLTRPVTPTQAWVHFRIPLSELRAQPYDFACQGPCHQLPRSADRGAIAFRARIENWTKDTTVDFRSLYFE